jgi:hypothetical protein
MGGFGSDAYPMHLIVDGPNALDDRVAFSVIP